MNHYLLHVTAKQERANLPWQTDLTSRGIVVLRAGSRREAEHFCLAYGMMMILLEIDETDEQTCETITAIGAAHAKGHAGYQPPILGLAQIEQSPEQRAALAEAGLADLISYSEPEAFILWRIETLAKLADLRHFEQSRMDVVELANRTRNHLHDLSQPLSAVQGRLQLMAARCPSTDPNSQTYQDLVRLIFEVSHQLMEIQQIHRQFS